MNLLLMRLLIFCLVAAFSAEQPLGMTAPTTTVAPPASTTTAAPPAPTTTVAPPASTTTAAPPAPTTTVAPPASTTTAAPPGSTTTAAPPGSTTTVAPPGSTTTVAPSGTTPGTVSTTTVATTITATQGQCVPNPCIGDSFCQERHEGFVCICRPGLFYDNVRGCSQAKVFPAILTLDEEFKEDMNNKMSEMFRVTAERIQKELAQALNGDGYINSTVLSLKSGSIIAEVQNFYELSSSATTISVTGKISEAIDNHIITNGISFDVNTVCSIGYCDTTTTDCMGDGIATCSCKEGYIRSQSTSQACISCPSGKQAIDSERCETCPFGFSGLNCNDSYLLAVVVVSCVLGVLLIIFMVSLIVVSCRNPKVKSSSKEELSPYKDIEMEKPAGVPRIPRANPNAGWQPANLEITKSGSTQALVTKHRSENKARYTDYDDYDEVSYKSQVPPAYSGYGVKGVENGSRGLQNSSSRQDDDRMRRY